ncbi:M56 family metallopeptidase [Hamadaea sp. NPDC051192]|uniref:M56 family metallopeptidase n=1 Tax=Hamadaea sp. NPDC051192 TaxID=3154940 RepID=UPI003440AA0C
MTVIVVMTAASSMWALALLAAAAVDDTPLRGWMGMRDVPVPGVVTVAAGVLLAVVGVRVGKASRRWRADRRQLVWLRRSSNELVVVTDDAPIAFAAYRRIVISTRMIDVLSPGQRRVVLAHAHLRARHPFALRLADLAVAVNPLLAGIRDAIGLLCERAADESAAAEVQDRRLVAQTIGLAALASPSRATVAGLEGSLVVARIAALHAEPPRARRTAAPAAAVISAAVLAACIQATVDFVIQLDAHLP